MMKVEIKNGRVVGYITPKEFAERIGVTDGAVRVWIKRGVLQVLKIGDTSWIKEGTNRPSDRRHKKSNRHI